VLQLDPLLEKVDRQAHGTTNASLKRQFQLLSNQGEINDQLAKFDLRDNVA
jgi:hypothetical protein